MKIFCDTNIVMEYLQQRIHADEVEKILTTARQKGDALFISSGSFYTITYLTEKYLKADSGLSKEGRLTRLRYILNGVLSTFMVAYSYSDSLYDGVNDVVFDDLEDSYQAHTAEEIGCNVLLTINDKHFSRYSSISTLVIKTPTEFIKSYGHL